MLCSECFKDEGLRLLADKIGFLCNDKCENCHSHSGHKLDKERLIYLADRFYRAGTLQRFDYGAAPAITFNEMQKTSVNFDEILNEDTKLLSLHTGMVFFHYGPRYWMFGEVEPLKALQNETTIETMLSTIIDAYSETKYDKNTKFYRLRKNPENPEIESQYDTPPKAFGEGRLDSVDMPVMYASFDLEVCIHECRVTADDELYLATLRPKKQLRLIDFSQILEEENVTEFESIDMAVFMLFMARDNSYPILRRLSQKVYERGYDGLIYPSYFSMLHSGSEPFETTFGLSHRRIAWYNEHEEHKVHKNLAIFGRPISDEKVVIERINKLFIRQVKYEVEFGPVTYN
ncbi:TPA: RES family NAD+ phosphorylase [Klebsiella pneumoniae]